MSIKAANYIIDNFDISVYSIHELQQVLDDQGISVVTKEDSTNLQKFLNRLIAYSEKEGGCAVSYSTQLILSIMRGISLSSIEGQLIRIIDFSKAVVLHCEDYGAKANALLIVNTIFDNYADLSNQYIKDFLPRFKELVYFILDCIKNCTIYPFIALLLTTLSILVKALQSSIKPISPNIETAIMLLFDHPDPLVTEGVAHVLAVLTRCDKTEETWKLVVSKVIRSTEITYNEIIGVNTDNLSETEGLRVSVLSNLGHIPPFHAIQRINMLFTVLRHLLRNAPPFVSFPLLSLYHCMERYLDAFVPAGRRSEEASVNGIAASPHEQWMIWNACYGAVFACFQVFMEVSKSHLFLIANGVATLLTRFLQRHYKEYSITYTILVSKAIRCFLINTGACVVYLLKDAIAILISVYQSINTARDKVTLTGGKERKRNGRKGKWNPPVMTITKAKDEEKTQDEEFTWLQHKKVEELYTAVIMTLQGVVLNGYELEEMDRSQIDIITFSALLNVLSSSPANKSHHIITYNKTIRDAILDLAMTSCTCCYPTGQLSPLLSLLSPFLACNAACSSISEDKEMNQFRMCMMSCLQHAPSSSIMHGTRNVIDVSVNEIREIMSPEPEEESRSVKRAAIPVISSSASPAESEVKTVEIATGEKKLRVEEPRKQSVDVSKEIVKLRKLSVEFIDSERKMSIEHNANTKMEEEVTPMGSDFEFSDDGEDLDIADIDA